MVNRLDCPGGGVLLLTAFPGLANVVALDRRSDIIAALNDIAAAGAAAMLTLVEQEALARYDVADFGDLARAAGLDWRHLPIADFSVPGAAFAAAWRANGSMIHRRLDAGETVVTHCRAGLGRTGTVAAMILIERGATADEAIAAVRKARPGTIETDEQEQWVRAIPVGRR